MVEVLARASLAFGTHHARRFRSETTVFGMPLVDIAMGPRPEFGEMRGKARGFVAIGDDARGFIAIGGFAMGGVTLGGGSIGVFSIGGGAIGLLSAVGGGAVSPCGLAVGGGAIGVFATGGGALGVYARGGGAIGYYAEAPGAIGMHVITLQEQDPQAVAAFDQVSWLMSTPSNTLSLLLPAGWAMGLPVVMAMLLLLIARMFARMPHDDSFTRN